MVRSLILLKTNLKCRVKRDPLDQNFHMIDYERVAVNGLYIDSIILNLEVSVVYLQFKIKHVLVLILVIQDGPPLF